MPGSQRLAAAVNVTGLLLLVCGLGAVVVALWHIDWRLGLGVAGCLATALGYFAATTDIGEV